MKKFLAMLLALVMALSLVACGSKNAGDTQKTDDNADTPAETVELTVFAAASLTESLTAIGEKYMAANENVKISFNFDSSGKLLTQIKEGAVCDLFISAVPKQMNALDGTLKDDADKNPDGLDMLVEGSRIDLLENKVALAVAEGNDKGIDSFDKLADLLKNGDVMLAIGNSDVPVGQYTQKIFAYYGIDETAIADKLSHGSNVKEVTTAVSEGTVDCGIIYASRRHRRRGRGDPQGLSGRHGHRLRHRHRHRHGAQGQQRPPLRAGRRHDHPGAPLRHRAQDQGLYPHPGRGRSPARREPGQILRLGRHPGRIKEQRPRPQARPLCCSVGAG